MEQYPLADAPQLSQNVPKKIGVLHLQQLFCGDENLSLNFDKSNCFSLSNGSDFDFHS
jgi:hypothetical protein